MTLLRGQSADAIATATATAPSLGPAHARPPDTVRAAMEDPPAPTAAQLHFLEPSRLLADGSANAWAGVSGGNGAAAAASALRFVYCIPPAGWQAEDPAFAALAHQTLPSSVYDGWMHRFDGAAVPYAADSVAGPRTDVDLLVHAMAAGANATVFGGPAGRLSASGGPPVPMPPIPAADATDETAAQLYLDGWLDGTTQNVQRCAEVIFDLALDGHVPIILSQLSNEQRHQVDRNQIYVYDAKRVRRWNDGRHWNSRNYWHFNNLSRYVETVPDSVTAGDTEQRRMPPAPGGDGPPLHNGAIRVPAKPSAAQLPFCRKKDGLTKLIVRGISNGPYEHLRLVSYMRDDMRGFEAFDIVRKNLAALSASRPPLISPKSILRPRRATLGARKRGRRAHQRQPASTARSGRRHRARIAPKTDAAVVQPTDAAQLRDLREEEGIREPVYCNPYDTMTVAPLADVPPAWRGRCVTPDNDPCGATTLQTFNQGGIPCPSRSRSHSRSYGIGGGSGGCGNTRDDVLEPMPMTANRGSVLCNAVMLCDRLPLAMVKVEPAYQTGCESDTEQWSTFDQQSEPLFQ